MYCIININKNYHLIIRYTYEIQHQKNQYKLIISLYLIFIFMILNIIKYFARTIKPSVKIQQKLQQRVRNYQEVPHVKQHDKQQRIDPGEMDDQGLAKIRLNDQHLPKQYLKRVQQVFGKYDQSQMRQMADLFSDMMNLKYKEKKTNFTNQKPFARFQQELTQDRKVEKIILKGKQNLLNQKQQKQTPLKEDQKPIGIGVQYTQNLVLSYLLKRVPRTFATAVRIFTQIQFRYPKFKPKSMLDFGSGLSSGSYAFADIFGESKQIYNIEPNQKMFKLSKFLSQDFDIKHFRALGQLSRTVRQVDIVYAGYVFSEIQSEMIPLFIQALVTKVKPGGFLVVSQYGNPFGARLIHDIRNWAIQKKLKIVMPCTHQSICPLANGERWCHFDQPAGNYPRRIFGKLPTQQAIKNQKFCYLVIQKQVKQQQPKSDINQPNVSAQWDRVIFPTMKKGGHVILELCTRQGRFQRRVVAKSHGQQYKEARNLRWGDLWRFQKRIPNKYRKQGRRGKRLW